MSKRGGGKDEKWKARWKRKKVCWRTQLVALWCCRCRLEGRVFPMDLSEFLRDIEMFLECPADKSVVQDVWRTAEGVARLRTHGTSLCRISLQSWAVLDWRTDVSKWTSKKKLRVLGFTNRLAAGRDWGVGEVKITPTCYQSKLTSSVFDALLADLGPSTDREAAQ